MQGIGHVCEWAVTLNWAELSSPAASSSTSDNTVNPYGQRDSGGEE